ncbi:hypothetical protein TorRG33x02_301130 [Trema orientale]|uniref:Uncharacterized protein n=1 Tax=Trema orientale TaxID=63057 RepID=A0A2P5C1E7_TREOI|nr:hypothetical protein TorRG33x02_301130 [Trema orientale]
MTLVTCLLESSKKMVPDHRVEAMPTKAIDVSDDLRINEDISGAMEKHLARRQRSLTEARRRRSFTQARRGQLCSRPAPLAAAYARPSSCRFLRDTR